MKNAPDEELAVLIKFLLISAKAHSLRIPILNLIPLGNILDYLSHIYCPGVQYRQNYSN